jgi:hypothetical protein
MGATSAEAAMQSVAMVIVNWVLRRFVIRV